MTLDEIRHGLVNMKAEGVDETLRLALIALAEHIADLQGNKQTSDEPPAEEPVEVFEAPIVEENQAPQAASEPSEAELVHEVGDAEDHDHLLEIDGASAAVSSRKRR